MPGTLYIVATPIGNLEDITLRALRVLREEAALIACEDTRQTQKLLTHYEIQKPLRSYHEHNEAGRARELVALLEGGQSIALVSDAGTPLLSDPGYRLVRAAVEAGITVVPLPGASAALAAVVASGMATDALAFLGFFPAKAGARREKLKSVREWKATLVAYESPHRILEALEDVAAVLGEREMTLGREITKIHEEFLRGTAVEIRAKLESRGTIKGEMTLVIGRAAEELVKGDAAEEVERLEKEGRPRMEAIKSVAKQMGLPKRAVYQAVEERGNNHAGRSRDSGETHR